MNGFTRQDLELMAKTFNFTVPFMGIEILRGQAVALTAVAYAIETGGNSDDVYGIITAINNALFRR